MQMNIDYLGFLKEVGKSKRLLRSGWIREKVNDPESVAEHSFRVGVLAMVLSDAVEVDKDKLIKMALLHDLAEVTTGDIVTERWAVLDIEKRDEKEKAERDSIYKFFQKIGEGKKYQAIFDEMIARVTLEAKLFWQLDKLEMAIQAYEYEKEQNINLEEFFETSEMHIKHPMLRQIFDDLLKLRKKK